MRPLLILMIVISLLIFFSAPTKAETDSEILKGIISGGLNQFLEGIGNGLINDNTVSKIDNSSAGNNGFFDFMTEPIPYASENFLRDRSSNSMPLIVAVAKLLILITALACIGQLLFPDLSADITAFFNGGRATYYEPKEVLLTGRNLALWFLCGPGLLLGLYFVCNRLMEGIDTSVLSQVVVSSENLTNYLFFGVLARGVKVYMAIRSMIFLEVSNYWYIFGFLFAIKKTRWLAILSLEYLAIQVFIQPVIVVILTNVVAFTLSGSFSNFGPDVLIYGCLNLLLFSLCFLAATAPIWIKIFSPSTIRTIIGYAKGF